MSNQKYIKVNENGKSATYTWQKETDSLGNHMFYSGPCGCYTTTHISWKEVVKDALKHGFKIIESNIDYIQDIVKNAEDDIRHEEKVNEEYKKNFGSCCILI